MNFFLITNNVKGADLLKQFTKYCGYFGASMN